MELGTAENIPAAKINEWLYRFGNNIEKVIAQVKTLRSKIADPEKLFEAAELLYSVENEMVYHLNDFLIRRTGKIFFDRKNAEKQIDYLSNLLALQFKIDESTSLTDAVSAKEAFESAVAFS